MNFVRKLFSFILSCRPIKVPPPNYAKIVSLSRSNLLDGRTALISGGTSGIGYAIARSILKAGGNVIITGRNPERLQNASKLLSEETDRFLDDIETMCFDVSDPQAYEKTLTKYLSSLSPSKRIDILVNNAGIARGCFGNCSLEDYNSVMDTNLKGPFFLSQLIANYMVSNNIKGNILNIASSSSLRPGNTPYILSKWGLRSLTLGMAKLLLPHGIVVNAIAPGPTSTPMLKKTEDDNIRCETVPSKRYTLPSEIGDMAVILVSDLGRTIVGDVVYMTGGAGILTYDDCEYDFKI